MIYNVVLVSDIQQSNSVIHIYLQGFPGGLEGKASTCNEGDPDSIPELGRSPGEGNGNPFQYSCLENPMEGRVWEAAVHGGHKLSDYFPL